MNASRRLVEEVNAVKARPKGPVRQRPPCQAGQGTVVA